METLRGDLQAAKADSKSQTSKLRYLEETTEAKSSEIIGLKEVERRLTGEVKGLEVKLEEARGKVDEVGT